MFGRTMNKLLTGLIVFILFVFLFPESTFSQEFFNEHIRSFDVAVQVKKSGVIEVEESIAYDFGNLSRHGIYRNIPYIRKNKDGKEYRLTYRSITVTDELGKAYPYAQSTKNSQIELKIGDPDTYQTGLKTYKIRYEVSGALTYFSDHDELYWNVTGNDWTVPIVASTFYVRLPQEVLDDDIRLTCFTGAEGSTETNCDNTKLNSTVTFRSLDPLMTREGMTAVVGFPKSIVAVLEPEEVIPFNDTILGKIVIVVLFFLALFWYLVLPVSVVWKWFRYGRDPASLKGETRAWFDPPTTSSGRFLTPSEVGTLFDEHAGFREVSALVVDLARRGYLKIVEEEEGTFKLVKMKETDKKMEVYEKSFFDDIFTGSEEVSLKRGELVTPVSRVKADLYRLMVKEKLFPHNPEEIRSKYMVLGFFALFTFNIFLAVVSFIFGLIMPRKTQLGSDALAVAKSLRKFLVSQERQLEFQAKNQLFFEKLLPYAIAFGVESVWIERFKDMNLREPEWYQGAYGNSFSTRVFATSLRSSFSQMSSASTNVTSSTGHSSGFSGGSSGGGGGGGGGGSW